MTQPNHSRRCRPLALLAATLALACSSTASAEQVLESASVARVVDGDTVVIRYETAGRPRMEYLRFGGIDTPESDQPYGEAATRSLREHLKQADAVEAVVQDERGPHERLIGTLRVDGESVSAWLVREGHAWVYRKYNDDPRLLEAEEEAREAQRGLWRANDPMPPWEWRHR